MSRNNLTRIIRQAEAVLKTRAASVDQESCICFPRTQLFFHSPEHRQLAYDILCPLHGRRFDLRQAYFTMYQAEWLREGFWERQWADFDPQTRKAMRATFKTRESYGLPSTTDYLADQP